MIEHFKILYILLVYLLLVLLFLENNKKKLSAHYFRPPDPKSEKNSRKSTNKKILALTEMTMQPLMMVELCRRDIENVQDFYKSV